MELWKKIMIGVASLLVILGISGYCVYKYYIIPKHIEPMLHIASDALKDPSNQEALADLANELVEEGALNRSTAKEYIRKINKLHNTAGFEESDESALDAIQTDEDIHKHLDDEDENAAKRDNESMIVAYSSNSNIGIETIKSEDDYPDSEPASYHSYSDKQDYIEYNQSQDAIVKENEGSPLDDEQIDDNDAKKEKAKSLYNNIINAMNSNERSTFFSVMTKVSVEKLKTLYNSGGKNDIKTYLKETLDEQTYKTAVTIFYKYAHLLYEDK